MAQELPIANSSTATRKREPTGGNLRRMIQSIGRSPGAMIGFGIVVILVAVAILAPLLAPYDPFMMGAAKRLQTPSWAYPFGTDEFGRDIFSRVMYGSRLTLMVGAIAVGISLTTGLVVGIIGGYAGGWIERILMRSTDVLFSFPDILIALAAVAILGPTLKNAMIAVGVAAIPFYARIAYAQVIVEKNRPYFEAAIGAGAGHLRLIFRHLLPNVMPSADRGCHARHVHRDARCGRTVFLGSGRSAATTGMGPDVVPGEKLYHARSVDHDHTRGRDRDHRAWLQPAGRRYPRGD